MKNKYLLIILLLPIVLKASPLDNFLQLKYFKASVFQYSGSKQGVTKQKMQLELAKPSSMLIEIKSPDQISLLLKDNSLTQIDYDLEQITTTDISEQDLLLFKIFMAKSESELSKYFSIRKTSNGYALEPLGQEQTYSDIKLSFEQDLVKEISWIQFDETITIKLNFIEVSPTYKKLEFKLPIFDKVN